MMYLIIYRLEACFLWGAALERPGSRFLRSAAVAVGRAAAACRLNSSADKSNLMLMDGQ